ncbi:hypothetical protein NUW54_g10856 [Trametes sanguinea]|uniref:Uncharacterized protein n=1 Tax=Trametes sanguinea TaxID=158606 RepID=A0ACC1NQJ5_9APHY|nr:hypothetical protein NUW54_g10856 [Trametes sanguinea]
MVKIVWDVSDRPHEVTNYKGKAVLGYLTDGDDNNEHLQFEHPLAEGFNLTAGHVKVRVPDMDPRNEYIVVRESYAYFIATTVDMEHAAVFGDSGNRSPKFNIVS